MSRHNFICVFVHLLVPVSSIETFIKIIPLIDMESVEIRFASLFGQANNTDVIHHIL